MKRSWIISLALSFVIIMGGVFAFTYIMDTVPDQIEAEPVLSQPVNDEDNQKQVPKKTKDIIYESQKLVVQIELSDGTIGSGFLYNDQGDIVTNAHVVANHKDVTVMTTESKEMPGEVIGVSRNTDVAVVRVPGLKGREPLPVRSEETVELLDEVLALGSPLGLQNTVTRGEISGLDRNLQIDPFEYEGVYQISAPISPGNSGGPLIDGNTGEVIGINSAKIGQETIGFSIPIADVLPMVKQWSESPMESLPEFPELTSTPGAPVAVTDAEQATYLVQYFYDSVNQGDFVTAYSLLGSSWQETTTFEQFRSGYYNTLSVEVDNLVADPTDSGVKVTAFLTAEETKNGEVSIKKYKVTYPVKYENKSMKILNGSGEELTTESNEDD
ncbi:trypsin-like peptidase domain-containing protein [Halobacillus locisalis]|uniref:Trypsin-like peptidase domain-containing protein n=1 Tax=Halobacillus locisalis TaxID=220753 RepID=A0A838CRD2_9BACI|nr:trypsin-like peptidase domain-containing protein [Halobacillus locisalis]MBA2174423.1 trypsin-like peptidase domain-containing protein [Halobacillus locisalis]